MKLSLIFDPIHQAGIKLLGKRLLVLLSVCVGGKVGKMPIVNWYR